MGPRGPGGGEEQNIVADPMSYTNPKDLPKLGGIEPAPNESRLSGIGLSIRTMLLTKAVLHSSDHVLLRGTIGLQKRIEKCVTETNRNMDFMFPPRVKVN